MNIIFWFFSLGLLVAAFQDLHRREIDNWLNLFLFFSGFSYILLNVFLFKEISLLINFGILVFVMFLLANLFYLMKVFSGGDCKLLFALTPLFVSVDLFSSFKNVILFCLLLLFVGAVYGLFWIIYLFFKDFKKNKIDLAKSLRKNKWYLCLIFFMLPLGFLDTSFFILVFIILFTVILFFLSKAVEKNSLSRSVHPRDLREGDWLEKRISFKGKIFNPSFEGLSLDDIKLLRNYPRHIRVRDGVPYAPVFLVSWIIFYFNGILMEFLDVLLEVLRSLF